ncbi:putative disease resistance protein RGA4 isoform X2 [Alnus glutinosa]|uniref:putative disease resistance protein RGA4 isoform X2 n=1 Tax=Alnus glutinosa TaxID=3517 RepID=UPI002D791032|nr:putative disease resistance protein RGA4 isoform X2 [Alnus glutinosa]
MAEAVLFNVAASIITSSGSLACQEIGLLWGFKDELKKLRNTVSTIQAVLLDAEEQQAHNHAVKDWLGKLKDAMYEADDLLDDYSTELLRRQVMTQDNNAKQIHIFFSKSNQLVYGHKMGYRIKAVRAKLNEIAEDRKNFNFTPRLIETQLEHRRREDTHSFVPEEKVIGREDEKKAVKALLFNSNVRENVSIIPIVGIGGQGKTTLARCVYNDEEVQRHFDLRLWACVSDPFDVKSIVQKLIELATRKRPESLEIDPLQIKLRETIGGKRYLLVLDDVWNENSNKWSDLEDLLVGGLRGSKVLVTTRNGKVANITHTASPYFLGGLSESNSWELFKKMAFKDGEEPKNPKLVEIGREIVKKCARVPLAIRSIGSLLSFENSEAKWPEFQTKKLYEINQQDIDIFPILKLSYDHLPPQLKQCFAFCSLFPKDYKIEVEALIQLWTAQGFIHSSDRTKRLEDVGREYFMDLLWRSFFQDIERNKDGDIERCKMHDLIHDLAQFVAGDECLISNPDAVKVVERTRHVAFDSLNSLWDISAPLLEANRLRTLLLRPSVHAFLMPKLDCNRQVYDTLITSFKCLRSLNLSDSYIQEVPNSIGKKESSVPKQKGGLSDLNGLDELRGSLRIKGLEHLRYSPLEDTAANLERKQYLRILELEWDPFHIEASYDSDEAIANDEQLLQNLRPHLNLKELSIEGYAGVRFSGWVSSLSNLVSITIRNCKWCQQIPPLDRFPFLEYLSLENLSALEYISNDASDVSSSSLQSLSLRGLPKLRGWWRMREAVTTEHEQNYNLPLFPSFPSLSRLLISNCPIRSIMADVATPSSSSPFSTLSKLKYLCLSYLEQLEYLPEEWPQNLSSLEVLNIWACPKLKISMSPHFQHLTALEYMSIKYCKELISNEEEEGAQCLGPTTLRRLQIDSVTSLVSLPRELRHATALQWLEIWNCPSLVSLPEWIADLTSLQTLQIGNCYNLISLPEAMRRLTSLSRLTICECLRLEERCEEGIGEDWPKIAHIPNVSNQWGFGYSDGWDRLLFF